MIVLDANILLYAYDTTSAFHRKARFWLETVLSNNEPVGLPWQSITAFLRVVTNPRLQGDRFTVGEAARIVDLWIGQPNVRLLAPGENHWPLLRKAAIEGQASGPLVSDAHLAALTTEYGGVLHTTDRDFARFAGLRCVNPIE
jgi:uncharacterized protein